MRGWVLRSPLYVAVFVAPLFVRAKFISTPESLPFLHAIWPQDWDLFTWWKSRAVMGCGIVSLLFCIGTYFSKHTNRSNWVLFFSMVYLFFVALSSFQSPYPNISLFGILYHHEGALTLASYIFLMLLSKNALGSIESYLKLFRILAVTVLVMSIVGVIQYGGGNPYAFPFIRDVVFSNEELAHAFVVSTPVVSGTLGGPNYLGSYCALLTPLFFGLSFAKKSKASRGIWFFSFLMLVFLTFVSRSRTGLIGAMFGSTWICFSFFKQRRKGLLKCLFTLFATSLILFSIAGIRNGANEYFRLFTKGFDLTKKSLFSFLNDFSVMNGVVRIVVDGKGLLIRKEGAETRFHRLDGSFLPVRVHTTPYVLFPRPGSSIEVLEPGYENLDLRVDTHPELGFFLRSNFADLVPTPYGYKVFVWNIFIDSRVARRSQLIPNDLFGSSRGYIWARTLPLISEAIFVGYGPDTFPLLFPQTDFIGKIRANYGINTIIDRPHNYYLQVAHASGVLSLLLLLLLFGSFIFKGTLRTIGRREGKVVLEDSILTSILGAIIGYLVLGLANDSNVGVAPIFWVLLGAGLSLTESRRPVVEAAGET